MSETISTNLAHKLRYTPMRDLLRGRITGRLDVQRAIREAQLPEPIKQLITRIVRKTRLWPLEKVDVAAELIAHFADAFEAGVPEALAVEKFGDVRQAARLIRRSKVRCRPLAWHVLRALQWAFVVSCIIYGALALRFITATPTPTVNYLAILNAPALQSPPASHAWPLYEQAMQGLGDGPTPIHVDDEFYYSAKPALDEWITAHQQQLALIRQASRMPSLGYVFRIPDGAADGSAGPALLYTLLPPLNEFRMITEVLDDDAALAARQRDGQRLIDDITAMHRIGEQLRGQGFLVQDMVALGIRQAAIDRLGNVLVNNRDLLSDEDLQTLAHLIAGPHLASDLFSFDHERMFFQDTIQRMYSDNGHGDGQLTLEGLHFLKRVTNPGASQSDLWPIQAASSPLLAASRAEVMSHYNQIMDAQERALDAPAWRWDLRAIDTQVRNVTDPIRYAPLAVMLPAVAGVKEFAARYLGQRDGVLTALALEAYRRANGRYPASLDALVPMYLGAVPADQITGEPIRFRMSDSGVLIYSVGVDRDDDAGRPPMIHNHLANRAAAAWETSRPAADGDWVLFPPLPPVE